MIPSRNHFLVWSQRPSAAFLYFVPSIQSPGRWVLKILSREKISKKWGFKLPPIEFFESHLQDVFLAKFRPNLYKLDSSLVRFHLLNKITIIIIITIIIVIAIIIILVEGTCSPSSVKIWTSFPNWAICGSYWQHICMRWPIKFTSKFKFFQYVLF